LVGAEASRHAVAQLHEVILVFGVVDEVAGRDVFFLEELGQLVCLFQVELSRL